MLFALGAFSLDLFVPEKYTVRGTFRLPLANLTQPFAGIMWPARGMGRISYFDDVSYTVYAGDKMYHVFTVD